MPLQAIEKKLSSLQAWVTAACAFALVASISLLVTTVVLVNRAQNKQNKSLACYVLPQLDRAEQSLPSIEYYRTHPAELKKQIEVIRQQRDSALSAWGKCD